MSNVEVNKGASRDGKIPLHGAEAFAAMRKAGRLAAEALDMLVPLVKPGVTTSEIDDLVLAFALDHGALPATLNYRGYRYSTCTSVNHVVCHGMPNDKPLRIGDIVNIDVTLIVDGWHGDTSRMYPVGEVSRRSERLMDVTYESLMRGIAAVRPGGTPAISEPPYRGLRRPNAAASCVISAVTVSDASSMTGRTSCIMASPEKASCWSRECSSPSSQ